MGNSGLRLVHDVSTRAVQFPYEGPLPEGGRLGLERSVAELFLVQVEIMCAPDGSQRFNAAIARRDELLDGMDHAQRSHASVIASAVGRIAARR